MNLKQRVLSTMKSREVESDFELYVTRTPGYLWALFFRWLHVHPIAVTLMSIVIGSASAYFFLFDDICYNLIGMLLLIWANWYDCADGQLARMTGKKTLVGRVLDGFAGNVLLKSAEGAMKGLLGALKSAGMNPEDVDYINAHGTSTPLGDMVEFRAVNSIFGGTNVSMSSTKSCVGHLLGAAGAVEAIYSVMAMNTGILPPTINLVDPEEETQGFDLVANTAKEKDVKVALSNSFGFGGTNGSLIFKKI